MSFIILFLLILVNAFFSAAEIAYVSVDKTEIDTLVAKNNRWGKILQTLLQKPNHFLSSIQICITLAGFFQSAIASLTLADPLNRFFTNLELPIGEKISVVIITIILSYFSLVLGELVPKRIAMQYSKTVALFTAPVIFLVNKIASPFVFILSKSVMLISRLFGVKSEKIKERYSEEEILSKIEIGRREGHIDKIGEEMISGIFKFDDTLAYEIMTPRTEVFMVDINDITENIDEMIKSRYSRIPFFDKDNDDIVGVLYMKDFYIRAKKNGWNRVNMKRLLQKPFFIPQSKKIDELFEEMKEQRTHMAFLIGEYGGVAGIVTTEDIIEEVMGNIQDEYDDDEPAIKKLSENSYEIDGAYALDDLSEDLGINLESDKYETVGGLLIDILGEIPDEREGGEKVVKIENLTFTIEKWNERRIEKIILEIRGEMQKKMILEYA